MKEILYEVNWHSVNDKFSHCTVTPITVTWRGILPGCTAESITATDSYGRQFQGKSRDFFETEEAAWKNVWENILDTIENNDRAVDDLKDDTFRLHRYLCTLAKPEDAA